MLSGSRVNNSTVECLKGNLGRWGMFGHLCGLDNVHVLSVIRHDCRVVLLSS